MKKDDDIIYEDNNLSFKDKEILIYGTSPHWHELRQHCEGLSPKDGTVKDHVVQARPRKDLAKPSPDASKTEHRSWQNRHVVKMQEAMDACGFGKNR